MSPQNKLAVPNNSKTHQSGIILNPQFLVIDQLRNRDSEKSHWNILLPIKCRPACFEHSPRSSSWEFLEYSKSGCPNHEAVRQHSDTFPYASSDLYCIEMESDYNVCMSTSLLTRSWDEWVSATSYWSLKQILCDIRCIRTAWFLNEFIRVVLDWISEVKCSYLWKFLITHFKVANIRLFSIVNSLVLLKTWVLYKWFWANRAEIKNLTIHVDARQCEDENAQTVSFYSWSVWGTLHRYNWKVLEWGLN